MLLANVAELVGVDQGPIAGYLTIAVSGGLHVSSCMRLLMSFQPVFVLAAYGYCDYLRIIGGR